MKKKSHTQYYDWRSILAVLLYLLSITSYAQTTSLITEVAAGEVAKNDSLSKYEADAKRRGNVKSVTFFRIGKLSQSQRAGYLTLKLHGLDKPIEAKAKSVKYFSDQDFEWIGKTHEDRGTVILISKDDRFLGHISTPDGVYEIWPAPSGLYGLHEIDRKTDHVGCADAEKLSAEFPITDDSSEGGRFGEDLKDLGDGPDYNEYAYRRWQ